jgi:hypothetical protein
MHPTLLSAVDEALQAQAVEPVREDDLDQGQDRALFAAWQTWLEQGGTDNPLAEFFDTLDENLQERLSALVQAGSQMPDVPKEQLESDMIHAVTRLRLRNLRRQVHELQFLQEDARASGDRVASQEYAQLNVEMMIRKRQLDKAMSKGSISARRQQLDAPVRIPFDTE